MQHPLPDSDSDVAVGLVLGVHGTQGQVRVRVHSDDPHRFDPGQTLYWEDTPLTITETLPSPPNRVILRFEGISSPAAARPLTGQWLTVPRDAVEPLPEGEYFHFQLIGLRVVTVEGEALGEVSEIIETGSNDVYVVNGPAGQVLIPAIASVVQRVDLEQGVMTVRLMEGMR